MQQDIKYQSVKTLNRESIRLRLLQERGGLIFERETVQADGGTQTQSLPVFSADSARSFMEADPYYQDLRQAYGQIYERVLRHFHSLER